MINLFVFMLLINTMGVSILYKNALSLMMMLEVFIISFLFLFLISLEKINLVLFSFSFLMMCLAVLAATMGLCLLSSLNKMNYPTPLAFF